MKKILILYNPLGYLFFLWLLFGLSLVENPLGWGSSFGNNLFNYVELFVVYSLSFFIGGLPFLFYNKRIENEKYLVKKSSLIRLKIILFISIVFLVARFIHIRDIPLLGDPFSRYQNKLGGFPDYPTRLIAPLGAFAFYLFYKEKRIAYLKYFIMSFVLIVLYTWRQEALNLILGVLMLYSFQLDFSVSRTLKFLCLTFIFLMLLVGGIGIVRFGGNEIHGVGEIMQLVLSFLHGEITTSMKFGAYVSNKLNGELLYGKYTLGSFISIFILGYKDHGAEYLKAHFTNANTAQSVSVPFSYFIDFGITGVVFFGILNGVVAFYLYKKFVQGKNFFFLILYITFYLQLMFSLRSGAIPFNPIFMYVGLGLFFIFHGEFKGPNINLFKPIFVLGYLITLCLSFLFLVIRI